MKHLTLPRFWQLYRQLPKPIQDLADKNYRLMQSNPYHPSLHLKQVDKGRGLWSVRIGLDFRALGVEKPEGLVWFWIGSHDEYDRLLS